MQDPRFPIGRFEPRPSFTADERRELIETLAATPRNLRTAVAGLTDEQLETSYRDGGWSLRQVIHHVPESHMNAYLRIKLALTENEPTVKPYDEAAWAQLPDVQSTPIDVSLALLDAIHARMDATLRTLQPADFERTFRHPEHGVHTVDWLLGLYAWHGRHHVAHVTSTRERMGW